MHGEAHENPTYLRCMTPVEEMLQKMKDHTSESRLKTDFFSQNDWQGQWYSDQTGQVQLISPDETAITLQTGTFSIPNTN